MPSQPAPIPPDDPSRRLTVARPDDDQSLPHVGLVGDTYTILVTGHDTAGRYTLIDMYVPPGGGPPPHRHDFEEMFTVLDGAIQVTFRGQTIAARAGQTINLCIAHGEGNYFCDPETLKQLEAEGLVAFRYCDSSGAVVEGANPNGSLNGIAGIYSPNLRILGLMPHPENLIGSIAGWVDGLALFQSLVAGFATA